MRSGSPGVYCVTFAGPSGNTLRGLVRDGDARWLWHVPACLGSVWAAWASSHTAGTR